MTTTERNKLRSYVQAKYLTNRRKWSFWRRWSTPDELTEAQIDSLISRCAGACRAAEGRRVDSRWAASTLHDRMDAPVGFSPLLWFMLGKFLLEVLMLWFNAQDDMQSN